MCWGSCGFENIYLLNLSPAWHIGEVPKDWKKASVVPMLKKDKQDDLVNHRLLGIVNNDGDRSFLQSDLDCSVRQFHLSDMHEYSQMQNHTSRKKEQRLCLQDRGL